MVYVSISKVWVGEKPPNYCPNCEKKDCMEYFANGGRGGIYQCKHCDTYVEWDTAKSDKLRKEEK